jgi:hypothetical protein
MPRVRFAGRIFPEAIKLSVQDNPQINWRDVESDLEITFTLIIQNGAVSVDCDVNKFDYNLHIESIYMRAFDLARATVDLAAFSAGWGLTVLLDKLTLPDGTITDLAPGDARLAALCTAFALGGPAPPSADQNDFHKVLLIVSTDWRIFPRTARSHRGNYSPT